MSIKQLIRYCLWGFNSIHCLLLLFLKYNNIHHYIFFVLVSFFLKHTFLLFIYPTQLPLACLLPARQSGHGAAISTPDLFLALRLCRWLSLLSILTLLQPDPCSRIRFIVIHIFILTHICMCMYSLHLYQPTSKTSQILP